MLKFMRTLVLSIIVILIQIEIISCIMQFVISGTQVNVLMAIDARDGMFVDHVLKKGS